MDEGGGYYDSGYIQPLDFFGDGPRIPMIAVSPFSRGGHISHSYADHASMRKGGHLAALLQGTYWSLADEDLKLPQPSVRPAWRRAHDVRAR